MLRHALPVWFLLATITSGIPKLNVPKILLPYYSLVQINFTLTSQEGCYIWSSQRVDIVAITPHYTKEDNKLCPNQNDATTRKEEFRYPDVLHNDRLCSSSATVSVLSRSPLRQASVITATERDSGQILRCDVIIDRISKIRIETTTRELFLADAPEEFIVKAYDEEGNTFSSLKSVPFVWNLLDDDAGGHGVSATQILKVVPFTLSSYAGSDDIRQLEADGNQGPRILVEGIKSGSALVNARLKDAAYGDVPADAVRLVVVANLMLLPSDIYVLPHVTAQFQVYLIRHGKAEDVSMPSNQYSLEVDNSTVCTLDHASSACNALELGHARVILRDKLLRIKTDHVPPMSSVHVVLPARIEISVVNARRSGVDTRWILQTDQIYEVTFTVFDEQNHIIFPSQNMKLEGVFPEGKLQVISSSLNNSYHVIRTQTKSIDDITANLLSVVDENGVEHLIDPVISQTDDIEILDPIAVQPSLIVFPWVVGTSNKHTFTPKASGGSGKYSWNSGAPSICRVHPTSGEISTLTEGSALVTVRDQRNPEMTASVRVHIIPVAGLKLPLSRVEAEEGSLLDLPVELYADLDGKRVTIADCRSVPLTVIVGDPNVFVPVPGNPERPMSVGCSKIRLRALQSGHTKVQVKFSHGKEFSDSKTVAAFKPLEVIDPVTPAIVVPASSKTVLLQGGPAPWILDSSGYYRSLSATDSSTSSPLLATEALDDTGSDSRTHSFVVYCTAIGDGKLMAIVGNNPTESNPYPANSSCDVRQICALPTHLSLEPSLPNRPNLPPCPLSAGTDFSSRRRYIPVFRSFSAKANVVVRDELHRRFDNISSLDLDWSISDDNLVRLSNENNPLQHRISYSKNAKKIAAFFTTLLFKDSLGKVTVSVTVSDLVDLEGVISQSIELTDNLKESLKSSVLYEIVPNLQLDPKSISLFNSPEVSANVTVSGGSRYYYPLVSNSSAVSVSVIENDLHSTNGLFKIAPIHEGIDTIQMYDLCIDSPPLDVKCHVSGVSRIETSARRMVQLYNETSLTVRAFDRFGNSLSTASFPLMNLQTEYDKSIIDLRYEDILDSTTLLYTVRGITLGVSNVIFRAQRSGVSSLPRTIQVYPPLEIEPKQITLIRNVVFQFVTTGGPRPSSSISYRLNDTSIGVVSSSGLFSSQQLGTVKLTVHSEGTEDGHDIIYSQDTAVINVVNLDSVRLYSPLRVIQTGSEMPVYVTGSTFDKSPFTFAQAIPRPVFKWSISGSDSTASLLSVYHRLGPGIADGDFAVRFVAKQPGRVSVKVRMVTRFFEQTDVFSDQVQIQIVEPFEFETPSVCSSCILLSPGAHLSLSVKPHGSSQTHRFSVLPLSGTSKTFVSVDSRGVLSAGDKAGSSILRVQTTSKNNQTTYSTIQVDTRSIAYMMINVDSNLQSLLNLGSTTPIDSVPLGCSVNYVISYHDDLGRQFHAVQADTHARPNRFDILDVQFGTENNTLILKAGEIPHMKILKAFVESLPHLPADYIPVNVNQSAISLPAVLVHGDVFRLRSPLLSSSKPDAAMNVKWSSSGDVLAIDSLSGIAVASKPGGTRLTLQVGDFSTFTEVIVDPLSVLTIQKPRSDILVQREESFWFPVETNRLPKLGKLDSTILDDIIPPFHCRIDMLSANREHTFSSLFHSEAKYDKETGQYGCEMNILPNEDLSSVYATMQLRAVSDYAPSDPVELTFYPTFSVHPTETVLTSQHELQQQRFIVSAIEQLHSCIEVIVSDPGMLTLVLEQQSSERLIYALSSAKYTSEPVDVSITFRCSITGQSIVTEIKLRLTQQILAQPVKTQGLEWAVSENLSFILLIALLALLVGALIMLGCQWLFAPTQLPASPNRSAFLSNSPSPPPYAADSKESYPSFPSPFSPSRYSPGSVPLWSEGVYSPDSSSSLRPRRSPQYNYSTFSGNS